MEKTCASSYSCQYRYIGDGAIGYGCKYKKYCDYQLPRDSRGGIGFCTCGSPSGHSAGTILDGSRFGKDSIVCNDCHKEEKVLRT